MRSNQKQRMRGRQPNNRRGPNPLTRSYESNGPDVKIRGNAQHVGEKYLQLARDAHTGGDPVGAENYLQHAEHYFRLIATAQAAQLQAQPGYVRPPGEPEAEDFDDDDDIGGLNDRFASPAERAQALQAQFVPPPPQPLPAPPPHINGAAPNPIAASQPQVQERAPYEQERPQPQGDRTGYQNRGDRRDQAGQRFQERGPRQDRNLGDRENNRRDGRRDFRPYRDQQGREFGPRVDAPNAPEAAAPAPGLPAFITTAPRPVAAPEVEAASDFAPIMEAVVAPSPAAQSASDQEGEPAEGDARFPVRVRRRRPRPPFGFAGPGQQGEVEDRPVRMDAPPADKLEE